MKKTMVSIVAFFSIATTVDQAAAYVYTVRPVRGLRPIVRGIPPLHRPPHRFPGIIIHRPPHRIYGRVIFPGRPGFPRGVPVYRPGVQY